MQAAVLPPIRQHDRNLRVRETNLAALNGESVGKDSVF